jgi:hypothetical protein
MPLDFPSSGAPKPQGSVNPPVERAPSGATHPDRVAALAKALAQVVPAGREPAWARELLSSLDQGALRFAPRDTAERDLIYALPAPAWAALDSACPGGIHRLDLPTPRDHDQLRPALAALRPLKGLRTLNLPVPENGSRIPLHELTIESHGLAIRLDCWRIAPWRVTAHEGVDVEVTGLAIQTGHSLKPTLLRMDRDGAQRGTPRALHGIVYLRQPKEDERYKLAPQDVDAWAPAQDDVIRACLNSRAFFKEGKATAATGDRPITCRHLTVQWLADRASEEGISYLRYASTGEIQDHVRPSTEEIFADLRRAPASALVHVDRLGLALRHQFGDMKSGERRHFMLASESHAMGLELHAKPPRAGRAAEYVLTLYDPNLTRGHLRLVLGSQAAAAGVSLSALSCWPTSEYFDESSTPIAELYRWPAPAANEPPAQQRLFGFTPEELCTPAFLHHAMRAGYAPAVVRYVQEALGASPGEGRNARLAGILALTGALAATLSDGHPDTPGAYVAALLDTPAATALTQDEMCSLLTLCYSEAVAGPSPTPLDLCLWKAPHATAAIVRCVLAHEAPATKRAMQILAWSAAGETPLSRVLRHEPQVGSRAAVRSSVYNFVHEVVASTRLSPDDKLALVTGRTQAAAPPSSQVREAPVASALAAGEHEMAAAMACAVLEAPALNMLRKSLLQAMGIDFAAVLAGLAASGQADAQSWLQRIIACLPEREVMPVDSVVKLLAPYASLGAAPAPSQAPRVRVLLQDDTFAAFDGTVHSAATYREAGLHALRLDSNPSLMVCAARHAIPGLEGYRLKPGTRSGPQSQFEGVRYLLPTARLRPVYEDASAPAANPDHKTAPVAGAGAPMRAREFLRDCAGHLERVGTALASAGAPENALALDRWLLSRDLNSMPLLHALATSEAADAAEGHRAGAVHEFTRLIVCSKSLPIEKKCALLGFGSVHEGQFATAAQAAIAAGRPDTAAAMACAVLESGLPQPERQKLLSALGLHLETALRQPAAGESLKAGDWTARLLKAVEQCGESLPHPVATAVLLRAGELGLGFKVSSVPAKTHVK